LRGAGNRGRLKYDEARRAKQITCVPRFSLLKENHCST
jgi:hypothetical protein